nr:hypothetical protein [Treponema pallidum]
MASGAPPLTQKTPSHARRKERRRPWAAAFGNHAALAPRALLASEQDRGTERHVVRRALLFIACGVVAVRRTHLEARDAYFGAHACAHLSICVHGDSRKQGEEANRV